MPKDVDYMRLCLSLARSSTPKPTNFRVGAALVSARTNFVLSTGYTLELPGNTHAEQCCLQKFAKSHNLSEERVGELLAADVDAVLYTTMEPCVERLSGNLPCIERILRTWRGGETGIKRVYTAVKEPDTFVKQNSSRAQLEAKGIQVIYVPGFEEEALQIATEGHAKVERQD